MIGLKNKISLFIISGLLIFIFFAYRFTSLLQVNYQALDQISFRIFEDSGNKEVDSLYSKKDYILVIKTHFKPLGKSFWALDIYRDSLKSIDFTSNNEKVEYCIAEIKGEKYVDTYLYDDNFLTLSDFVHFYNNSVFSGEVDVKPRELGADGIIFKLRLSNKFKYSGLTEIYIKFNFKSGRVVESKRNYFILNYK